MLPDIYIYILW